MTKARDLANAGTALTTVSATELGYLDGVTSAVQTQLDNKVDETGGSVISANSSGNALEIRQTGTGNALVVEDSTNPDASPLIIDADGKLLVGTTTDTNVGGGIGRVVAANTGSSWIKNTRFSADANGATIAVAKSRGTTIDSQGAVQSGDALGAFTFMGSDGTSLNQGAIVQAFAEANATTGSQPTRIVFLTSASGSVSPIERMRISADGTTTINAIAAGTTTTAAVGGGYMGVPQSSAATTGAYTIVAADAGEHIYSTATRTVTIPANASVAFPVGTAITFIAATGTTVTIAITSDTLLLAGAGTTGSRTLAPFGMATAIKITSTSWIISGNGLT